jgi:CheY-like chemotaxis protein
MPKKQNQNQKQSRIMIVEDDDMLVEIYRKKLSLEGYSVSVVRNGKEALSTLSKEKFDLVLLDLVMPEMDGFETLGEIKKIPQNQDLKIIITSNLSQENEKQKALDLGASGFLIKSNYDLNEFADKIKEFLLDKE